MPCWEAKVAKNEGHPSRTRVGSAFYHVQILIGSLDVLLWIDEHQQFLRTNQDGMGLLPEAVFP